MLIFDSYIFQKRKLSSSIQKALFVIGGFVVMNTNWFYFDIVQDYKLPASDSLWYSFRDEVWKTWYSIPPAAAAHSPRSNFLDAPQRTGAAYAVFENLFFLIGLRPPFTFILI